MIIAKVGFRIEDDAVENHKISFPCICRILDILIKLATSPHYFKQVADVAARHRKIKSFLIFYISGIIGLLFYKLFNNLYA